MKTGRAKSAALVLASGGDIYTNVKGLGCAFHLGRNIPGVKAP
jgi:hypothetical protein